MLFFSVAWSGLLLGDVPLVPWGVQHTSAQHNVLMCLFAVHTVGEASSVRLAPAAPPLVPEEGEGTSVPTDPCCEGGGRSKRQRRSRVKTKCGRGRKVFILLVCASRGGRGESALAVWR